MTVSDWVVLAITLFVVCPLVGAVFGAVFAFLIHRVHLDERRRR